MPTEQINAIPRRYLPTNPQEFNGFLKALSLLSIEAEIHDGKKQTAAEAIDSQKHVMQDVQLPRQVIFRDPAAPGEEITIVECLK